MLQIELGNFENRTSEDIQLLRNGRRPCAGKERNNESPCQESALFIDNKASERATRRCDEGKYSASISVRGCLSILDEYKVLRFRLPPSPSRRNKFALARVKRGESPRSAGGSARGCGESGERVRSRRSGGREKRRRKNTRGNGRGEREEASEKLGAQLQTAMGIFETTRPPPLAISFLRLALFRPLFVRRPLLHAAAHDRVSAVVSDGNACVYKRLCRFHVMRNPPQSCSTGFKTQSSKLLDLYRAKSCSNPF